MNKTSMLLGLQLLLLVAAGIHAGMMYGQVPDQMAVHFGGGGQPNGWMSKEAMFGLYAGLLLTSTLLFVGLAFLLAYIPKSLINMPHKEEWLTEPFREQTLTTLREQLLLFGVVTSIFLAGVMVLVMQANLQPPPVLDETSFLVAVGGFLAFTIVWCVGLTVRFRKPPALGLPLGSDGTGMTRATHNAVTARLSEAFAHMVESIQTTAPETVMTSEYQTNTTFVFRAWLPDRKEDGVEVAFEVQCQPNEVRTTGRMRLESDGTSVKEMMETTDACDGNDQRTVIRRAEEFAAQMEADAQVLADALWQKAT